MSVGLLSLDTHPREASVARVRVDGVDVTHSCFAANDVDGWAECFVRDADGHFVVTPDGTSVSRQRLRGRVVIDFPRGLD